MKIGNINLKNNLILAPLLGVNCVAYRLLCKNHGCDLSTTAMVHPDSLWNQKDKLDVIKEESPVSIQIVGKDPTEMAKAAEFLEPQADIIDINLGCPDQKVLANHAGAFLIKHPEQMEKMVSKVASSINKPVTAKIRIGWDDKTINAVEVSKKLENCGVQAIAVHGRTRKQGYTGKANWKVIRQVKESVNIPVIGNGDIFQATDYQRMINKTGVDAVMIGRGAMGNPQLFENIIKLKNNQPIIQKNQNIAHEYFKEFVDYYQKYSTRDNLSEIRQHAMWLAKGVNNGAALKNSLSKCHTIKELNKIFETF